MKAPQSVQLRSQVKEAVKIDFNEALKVARSISDGWYRCQSLAEVALEINNSKVFFLKIVDEALQAAVETTQPNRIVSVSSWIIWVMANRKDINDAEILPILEKMLEVMCEEPHPIKRSDALLFLFEAVYSRNSFREMILLPLLNACREVKNWKKPRTLGYIVLILAIDDLTRAKTVLEMIEKESKKERLLREIKENKWLGAHEFLPHYAKTQPKNKL